MSNVEELRRLRADFEREASRYPDLTFTVELISQTNPGRPAFRRPNHTTTLWQYVGTTAEWDREALAKAVVAAASTKYGAIRGAQLLALGVVEGPDKDLFCRMATRAASLIPRAARERIATDLGNALERGLGLSGRPGTPIHTFNNNSVAVWLNLVLLTLANFQRERLHSMTVAVDPFTASLAVFDFILLPEVQSDALPTSSGSFSAKAFSFVGTHLVPDEETYVEILRIIRITGMGMEQHPSTFLGKEEESIRDYLLVVLASHFESVTGETFNRKGKTDILVRRTNANVFVAECKFWSGEKGFLEAISQLLGYLTWRDSKSALLVFVRNKQLQPVLDNIRAATPSHTSYESVVADRLNDEGTLRCRFSLPTDATRSVDVSVCCFHFPDSA